MLQCWTSGSFQPARLRTSPAITNDYTYTPGMVWQSRLGGTTAGVMGFEAGACRHQQVALQCVAGWLIVLPPVQAQAVDDGSFPGPRSPASAGDAHDITFVLHEGDFQVRCAAVGS